MRLSLRWTAAIVLLPSLATASVLLAACQSGQSAVQSATSTTSTSSVSPAWKQVWNGRYSEHIQPIFNSRCISCHGPTRAENGLRLDSYEGVMKGSSFGPVVIPGSAVRSVLISVVDGRTADARIRMPPVGQRLDDVEVRNLIAWIEAGAPPE